MGEAIMKAVRWSFLVIFVIGGIWGMHTASVLGDFRYLMATVVFFGVVYIIYKTWGDLHIKVMVGSVLLIVMLGVFAQPQYAPYWYFLATGNEVPFEGYFKTWCALVASVGTIVMSGIFFKYDNEY